MIVGIIILGNKKTQKQYKIMQPKESKSNWHFRISIIKSMIRIMAGIALLFPNEWYINAAGGMLIGAEILGIIEEF
jgi:hypothetical protein